MKPNKPEGRYLTVNELRMHYLDWGDSENAPILLLHGLMAHAHVWDNLASGLRNLYHVLALDQRGHGESEWSREALYSLDDHFSDISTFIESLALKRIILLGHSMGGRNALFYTACFPEKVERLILVDARLGINPEAARALKRQLASLPLKANTMDEVVEALRKLYPYLSIEMCRHIAKYGYKQSQDGWFIPKYDIRMSMQIESLGYATEDLCDMIKNVACPTLIVRGKESPFLSPEETQRMCMALPGAEFQEIPGATHMPAQENPDAFKRVVLDFLDEQ
ncbi:MAG: alpha/beta hydrolase [Proteobacteria bacterium]|nr:alpha/beta hydrolase [Pseudomonadota bacterium]